MIISVGPAALVTTGAGRFYCNGIQTDVWPSTLFWLQNPTPEEVLKVSLELYGLLARLLVFPIPTFAAVNGHAFGGGAMLVLAHDYTSTVWNTILSDTISNEQWRWMVLLSCRQYRRGIARTSHQILQVLSFHLCTINSGLQEQNTGPEVGQGINPTGKALWWKRGSRTRHHWQDRSFKKSLGRGTPHKTQVILPFFAGNSLCPISGW